MVVVIVGLAVCLLSWLAGESVSTAVVTSGAAVAGLTNALVAVATFLAGHPHDNPVQRATRRRTKNIGQRPKRRV